MLNLIRSAFDSFDVVFGLAATEAFLSCYTTVGPYTGRAAMMEQLPIRTVAL